jgi:hypothetical protein
MRQGWSEGGAGGEAAVSGKGMETAPPLMELLIAMNLIAMKRKGDMTMRSVIELKRIALRNLARRRVKTCLTCAAIMVSVTVYIWMDSWIGGMFLESRRNIVNYEMGAAKIQTKGYFDKKDELPSYEAFGGWEDYAEALDGAGYNIAPRYAFSGTL